MHKCIISYLRSGLLEEARERQDRWQVDVYEEREPPQTASGLPPPSAPEAVTAARSYMYSIVNTGWTPKHDIVSCTHSAARSPVKGVAQDDSDVRVDIIWEELPVGTRSLLDAHCCC